MSSEITVITAKWIVPVLPKDKFYEDHSLVIQKEKIIDILPISESKEKYQNAKVIDLSEEHILMPGK